MTLDPQNYSVWNHIAYQPAIDAILPDRLLPYLRPGQRVLDVGCNRGLAAVHLARHGIRVVGIDINPDAVRQASSEADSAGVGVLCDFRCADVLSTGDLGTFDAIVMIRMLTCIPLGTTETAVLARSNSALTSSGYLYVHDFLMETESPVYRDRYQAGQQAGWRTGNFEVCDKKGKVLFVAHHHTDEELKEIMCPYENVLFAEHRSLSMNGNPCRMFEFIGRKG